ncbi:MAG: Trm112 family protein [Candidatus Omnitrophota bacterium]|nr:MAG: Trm112 family protein [Candidatus Omnitrophota bacterium]
MCRRRKEPDRVIDEELLRILACPACKADVVVENEKIVCTQCRRRYPVRDGIPIMLIEEAESQDEPSSSNSC